MALDQYPSYSVFSNASPSTETGDILSANFFRGRQVVRVIVPVQQSTDISRFWTPATCLNRKGEAKAKSPVNGIMYSNGASSRGARQMAMIAKGKTIRKMRQAKACASHPGR